MRVLNRWAVVIRFREPYLRWAASLDDKAPAHAEDLRDEMSVYLLPEDPDDEDHPPIKQYFQRIFDCELESWWTDEDQWPTKRDYATFLEWFDVASESVVTDLGGDPIRIDDL
jgi:hypothetical protein